MTNDRSERREGNVAKAAGRSRWRWLGVLGLLLALAIAMIPRWISGNWLMQPLLDRLAKGEYQLTSDRVELSWLGPMSLHGVTIAPLGQPRVLHVDQVRTQRGLIGFLLGGRKLGEITIVRPAVEVEFLRGGTNLQELLAAISGDPRIDGQLDSGARKTPRVDVAISIEGMQAQVSRAERKEPLLIVPPFDLRGTWKSAEGPPVLTLEPTKILDHVEITPELLQLGLDRVIPWLARSTWIAGDCSFSIDQITIPLDHPEKSAGTASLQLHQVTSGPSDPLVLQAIELAGRQFQKEIPRQLTFVEDSDIAIRFADGKVEHEGLRVGLPDLEKRFQWSSKGQVGIADRSLAMQVGMPVPVEWLARRDSVKELGFPELVLEVRGTLDQPEIDPVSLRKQAGQLLGKISSQVQSEAPVTAEVMQVLEGVAAGDADQAIAATIEWVRQARARREAARRDAEKSSEDPSQLQDETQPPTPVGGILERLRQRRRRIP